MTKGVPAPSKEGALAEIGTARPTLQRYSGSPRSICQKYDMRLHMQYLGCTHLLGFEPP